LARHAPSTQHRREEMIKQVVVVPVARPSIVVQRKASPGRVAMPVGKTFVVPRGSFGPSRSHVDGGALFEMIQRNQNGYISQRAIKQLMWQAEFSPRGVSVPAGNRRATSLPPKASQTVVRAYSPRVVQSRVAAPTKKYEFIKAEGKATTGYPVMAPMDFSRASSTVCPSMAGSLAFSVGHAGSIRSSVPSRMTSCEGSMRVPGLHSEYSPCGSASVPLPARVAIAQEPPRTMRQTVSGAVFPRGTGFPMNKAELILPDRGRGAPATIVGRPPPQTHISREKMQAKGQLLQMQIPDLVSYGANAAPIPEEQLMTND